MTERILLVSPYSFDRFGGVQQQVDGIATGLVRQGHDVVVLGPADRPHDDRAYRFVSAARSISVRVNGSRAPVAPTAAAFAAVRRTIGEFGPTVLHLHEPLVPGPSLFALWLFSGPVVGTFHRSTPGRVYPLYGRLIAPTVRKITVDVAVSQAALATAVTALGRRFQGATIVPNGIDSARIAPTGDRDSRPPAVLFVGRNEPRKGLRTVLEAFKKVPGEVELWIIGPGTEELSALYDDSRIRWLGTVDEDEKIRRLASARLFVAPSTGGESFGVVLLEAMAAGAAVIASDLPGYREAAGEAATYVQPGDTGGFTQKIIELLGDSGLAAARSVAGRRVAQQFDFATIAHRYEELYARARQTYSASPSTRRALRTLGE